MKTLDRTMLTFISLEVDDFEFWPPTKIGKIRKEWNQNIIYLYFGPLMKVTKTCHTN